MRIGTPYQLKKKITSRVKFFFNYFEFICGVRSLEQKKWIWKKLGSGAYIDHRLVAKRRINKKGLTVIAVRPEKLR